MRLTIQGPAPEPHRYFANDAKIVVLVDQFGDTPLAQWREVYGELWKIEKRGGRDIPVFAVSITDHPAKPWQRK